MSRVVITASTVDRDGNCNFCCDRRSGSDDVAVVTSTDPDRRLSIRFCPKCLESLQQDWPWPVKTKDK
jgi:hypothetical protein